MKRKGTPLDQQEDPYRLLKKTLDADGWAQIPVLSNLEATFYENQLWDFMKSLGTGICKDDPSTWHKGVWPPNTNGTIEEGGVAHMKTLWEIRAKESILEVYARLNNCRKEDLLVSFEGFNILRRDIETKSKPTKKHEFGTISQQNVSSKAEFYQGYLSLSNTWGGFTFYDKSHLLHKEFITSKKARARGGYELDFDDCQWFMEKPGCTQKHVVCSPGQLTLWDARTAHMDVLPSVTSQPRVGVFICYVPRDHYISGVDRNTTPLSYTKLRTDRMIAKKISVFESTNRATTYKPIPVKLRPVRSEKTINLQLWSNFGEPNIITQEELTPTMRRLIGYD